MKKFTFLGNSEATISMLIEIVHAAHGNNFELEVIFNLPPQGQSIRHGVDCQKTSLIDAGDWEFDSETKLFLGVNKPDSKKGVFEYFCSHNAISENNYSTLFHPQSAIASTATCGKGVVVNPMSVLAPFVNLGDMVSVNRSVSIGHHTTIGSFSTIYPGTNIAGNCEIGNGVLISMGCNIVDGITIGDNAKILAGSLVSKNIPANATVAGSPARIIKS